MNWGGKENILVLGMADVQENLRQGVIGDPFLNTIQEQFAEYLKQCGLIVLFIGSPNQEEQEESLRDEENMYIDNVPDLGGREWN